MILCVVRRRHYKSSVQIKGNCAMYLKYVNFCMEIRRTVLKSFVIKSFIQLRQSQRLFTVFVWGWGWGGGGGGGGGVCRVEVLRNEK